MQSKKRATLLFSLVRHQDTVFRATGWRLAAISDEAEVRPARRTSTPRHRDDGSDINVLLAELNLKLLEALDADSIDLKYKEAVLTIDADNRITKRTLPLSLSKHDIQSWARRQKMSRVEAVLLSLGFLLREDLKVKFEALVFTRRENRAFTKNIEHFPLVEAFLERDLAIAASDVFGGAHMVYRHQQADSVQIFEWFDRMDYSLPAGLLTAVRHYHGKGRKSDGSTEKPFHSTEIESANPKTLASIYAMIHAMAAAKPYSLERGSTAAMKKIETAILDIGLTMSEKTIRKHLDEAALSTLELKEKNQ